MTESDPSGWQQLHRHFYKLRKREIVSLRLESQARRLKVLSGKQGEGQSAETVRHKTPEAVPSDGNIVEMLKEGRRRSRPDPLVSVTEDLRAWFEEEPGRTGRELLQRLQSIYPGEYPDNLIRTVQRRVKDWRRDRGIP
ncbi:hypothetical protein [Rhizobium leguminosarum]|uniref:hypothetical protein n=1 Tax=Rhizobium leguminosarum TaxID=384 RepID=UPI001AE28D53|nr:hypothetical protein [Rhizobium leguminosarum]